MELDLTELEMVEFQKWLEKEGKKRKGTEEYTYYIEAFYLTRLYLMDRERGNTRTANNV